MSALPAWKLDSESEEDPSLRTEKALGRVGAKAKKGKKRRGREAERPRGREGYEAIEAMNRLQAANGTEGRGGARARGREMAQPADLRGEGHNPSPRLLGAEQSTHPSPGAGFGWHGNQAIKQSAARAGQMGPQRLAPTLSTAALELNRQQAEARLAEASQNEVAAPAVADLPIEGGRVFLELKQERPYETEEQREQQRQQKMLDVQHQFISAEAPSAAGAKTAEEVAPTEEPTAPEAGRRKQAEAGQKAYAQQMIVQAAELQAGQAAAKSAAEEQARAAAKSAAASAAAATEDFRFKQQVIRIGTQFAASPSIAAFFTGLLDLNVMGAKLLVGSKVDIPFLYTKTSKPHTGFLAAVAFFDIMIFASSFIVTGLILILVTTLVFAVVKFGIFQIIYGIYASLVS